MEHFVHRLGFAQILHLRQVRLEFLLRILQVDDFVFQVQKVIFALSEFVQESVVLVIQEILVFLQNFDFSLHVIESRIDVVLVGGQLVDSALLFVECVSQVVVGLL